MTAHNVCICNRQVFQHCFNPLNITISIFSDIPCGNSISIPSFFITMHCSSDMLLSECSLRSADILRGTIVCKGCSDFFEQTQSDDTQMSLVSITAYIIGTAPIFYGHSAGLTLSDLLCPLPAP